MFKNDFKQANLLARVLPYDIQKTETMYKKLILLAIAALPLLSKAQEEKKSAVEKILGEKSLPSIELNDINNKKINVSDYAKSGQITVLSFWATWCIPCKKELTNMAELYEEWQKKYNLKVVAVSIDDSRNVTKVKPYVEGQRWEYDVLLDVNQDLKRSLNIQSVPFTLLVDATGKIVYSHSGYVDGDEYILEDEIKKVAKN